MECAKLIVQSGIKRVVYLDESACQKQTDEQKSATKRLFDLSKVELVQLE
jgi:deoxycytidylate deaminase